MSLYFSNFFYYCLHEIFLEREALRNFPCNRDSKIGILSSNFHIKIFRFYVCKNSCGALVAKFNFFARELARNSNAITNLLCVNVKMRYTSNHSNQNPLCGFAKSIGLKINPLFIRALHAHVTKMSKRVYAFVTSITRASIPMYL